MALAILEWVGGENRAVRFRIDTGTNAYYQVKLGREVRHNEGIDWVDDVFFTSPIRQKGAGGSLLDSAREIAVAVPRFDEGKVYGQLFSYKNPAGKSPAFSRIVTIPRGFAVGAIPNADADFAPALSWGAAMNETMPFASPRLVTCRTHKEAYARQASLDELLAGIVKLAAPVVLDLLKGTPTGAGQTTPAGAAGATGNPGSGNLLAQLLSSLLGSLGGGVVGGLGGKALGQSLSLGASGRSGPDNRFLVSRNDRYSQPFIFGIDDALLGTLIGPILQVLPQLMNSANQQRLQMKQTDNKLVTDILSDVDRRRMLEELLQAQRPPAANSWGNSNNPFDSGDANQLLQLLQQMPPAGSAPSTPVPPAPARPIAPALPAVVPPVAGAAVAKSLSLDAPPSTAALSRKAVLSFVTADPVSWNGTPRLLFAQKRGMQLKVRLNVAEPAPKTPLPKAILKVVFKRAADSTVLYEKTFKQKGVLPNAPLPLAFAPEELARLPVDTPLSVIAEMRWLTPQSGREIKALGSTELVLVGNYFLKERGKIAGPERELTDMTRFRPFWNKIWEAPVLDAANVKGENGRKTRWQLDSNLKYSVLLAAAHESNGLMETKILPGQDDVESVFAKTGGRMKAGIELSVAELNKLLPLWDGGQGLDGDKLQALQTEAFARDSAGEFIFHCKLTGSAGERGMVWVVPVFAPFAISLNTVQTTDESGQVTAVGEESVRFPLPVSARVLGLKSQ